MLLGIVITSTNYRKTISRLTRGYAGAVQVDSFFGEYVNGLELGAHEGQQHMAQFNYGALQGAFLACWRL